jgi:hypothetical protein
MVERFGVQYASEVPLFAVQRKTALPTLNLRRSRLCRRIYEFFLIDAACPGHVRDDQIL